MFAKTHLIWLSIVLLFLFGVEPSHAARDNIFGGEAENTDLEAVNNAISTLSIDKADKSALNSKQDALSNSATLLKITEAEGLPLWEGGAWPGAMSVENETDPLFTAWGKNYNDLVNRPTLFSGRWADITEKPLAFIPETHTQTISTITGLQAALDNKIDDFALQAGEVGELLLPEDPSNGENTVGFSAPVSVESDVTYQLPATTGSVGNGFRVVSVAGGLVVLEQYHIPVVTISTGQPTGGSDGDVWYVVQ